MLVPVVPGSVVANSINSELRLDAAVCTNLVQSRLAVPVSSFLLAVALFANWAVAPVVLCSIVYAVCVFRLLALIATVNPYVLFVFFSSVVSSDSAAGRFYPMPFIVIVSFMRSVSSLVLVA